MQDFDDALLIHLYRTNILTPKSNKEIYFFLQHFVFFILRLLGI